MVRQRGNPRLAALARRRADLSSAHFGVAFQMPLQVPLQMPQAGDAMPEALAVVVPKRQLKRAVDRNALKRVAREAWRLAPWGGHARPQIVMVRLRRAEPDWKTTPRSALKKAWRAELDELFLRLLRRVASMPTPQIEAANQAANPVHPARTLVATGLPAVDPNPRDVS